MKNEFEVRFQKDGNVWSASLQGNDQRTAGFGESPEEALKDLFLEKDKDDYQKTVKVSENKKASG